MTAWSLAIPAALCAIGGLTPALEIQAPFRLSIVELVFSPDGKWLASGDRSGLVVIYAAGTGQRQHSLNMDIGVNSLAFSPDSRVLLAGGYGRVRGWDVHAGTVLHDFELPGTFPKHVQPGEIDDLAFIDRTSFVVAVRQQIQQWRLSDGHLIKWVETTGDRFGTFGYRSCCGCEVRAVAASPDGRSVAAGCTDGFAYLWDLRSGKLTEIIDGHGGHYKGPAMHLADGSRWLWAMPHGDVFGNDISLRDPAGERARLKAESTRELFALTLSPNGQLLAAGSAVGPIDVWRVPRSKPIASWTTGEMVHMLAFDHDSERLATGGENGLVQVWHARSGRLIWSAKR